MADHLEFEAIVREHQHMVFRTLARLVGRTHDIEDLAQDVFLRLYKALPSFRGDALVSTYLYRIAVNVAQDEWKRQRRTDRKHISIADESEGWEDRLAHPSDSAEAQLTQAEFADAVEGHLQQLSVVERSVLVLYHQEDQSYQQIAEALRLPIGTVRTHLHRGRKKLRDSIEADRRHPTRKQQSTPNKQNTEVPHISNTTAISHKARKGWNYANTR